MRTRTLWWWMVPAAVLLILGGMAAGIWLAKGRSGSGPTGPGVNVPPVPSEPPPSSPSGNPPAPQPPPEPTRPADGEAVAFIHSFMRARMNGDASAMGAMLAPSLPNKSGIRASKPGARLTGYTADLLGSGDFDAFIFRLRVAFNTGQPGGEVAAEDVRVTWKGGFKIASWDEEVRESLALRPGKDGNLYLSRGQDTALAASLTALPAMAPPFHAPPGVEFGVGKDGWSIAAPSFSGSHILWVTKGHHPLLGISRINWGGAPVITPLDLLFEAGVTDAAWAPGGTKYVAIATAQASGSVTLDVWDIVAKDRFGPNLTAATGTMEYMVKNIRWQSGTVVAFDVQKGGSLTGPWTYNVSTRQLTPQ